jgi:hypothetical protein
MSRTEKAERIEMAERAPEALLYPPSTLASYEG